MVSTIGLARALALAACMAGLALPTLAQTPAQAEVAHYVLDNGLEIVVIPDHRAPIVTHMLWYKIGSADEPPGKSGIAHFFEHLMFKGTKAHPAGEFSKVVSDVGGTENAFTANDYTAYFQMVPPDALATMMRFEADRMRGLVLSEDVIDAERDVVLEERRSRIDSSPRALLQEEVAATLYQNHPYRIPVIGWLHEMEQLNRRDAVAFYDRYYAPNNALLVVAGDVEPADVLAMAQQTYRLVPPTPDLPPRLRPSEPEHDTARTVTLHDPRVGVPAFSTSWVVPTYNSAAPGEAEALDLLAEILGGGIRSRLYQQVVVKTGIGAAAGAAYDSGAYDPSGFTVYGVPQGNATLAAVEAAVTDQIAMLIRDGVTPAELESAKTRFVRSLVFARDQQSDMANLYGRELSTGGSVEDIAQWPDRIRAVTAEQVQAVARRYLDPSVAVTGYLLPPAVQGQ
ncbi:M16 family metallopeptidase [uncultured Devosia sp.]|uniref:M16 family metallopeptidase n=1 Tax=uncultured Devosia sp. TaxID=211434 RepID=UPI0035CC1996